MSLSFEPVPFDVIRDQVCAHLNALPGRIDSFVESHIIDSNHYLLKSAGKVAGFASIHEGALITQFAMEPEFRYLGQQSYSGLRRLEQVRSAYVPISDEFFLAHALDNYRELKKQAFLFRLGQSATESEEFNQRLAGVADIDSIVHESGEFFEDLQQHIGNEEVFVTTLNGEPVGYGVIEQSVLYERVASIGMFTIERFRGQGVGAATIRGLIRVTQSRGLEPIAGCWYYNHLSKKTLERAGMYAGVATAESRVLAESDSEDDKSENSNFAFSQIDVAPIPAQGATRSFRVAKSSPFQKSLPDLYEIRESAQATPSFRKEGYPDFLVHNSVGTNCNLEGVLMSPSLEMTINRRRFQQLGIATAAALAIPGLNLASAEGTPEATPTPYIPPTPECGDGDDDELTIMQTEGPYFTPNSPERSSLIEDGMTGDHFIVTGYVYSTDCAPVAKALIDFWHCDDQGVYDNEGYRLRGHLFTDEDGLYRLETIKPGIYPGRTRHIHLKVQAPDGPVITTQLYWPNEPENERDGIYNPALEMEIIEPERADDPETGIYTFIVETAN